MRAPLPLVLSVLLGLASGCGGDPLLDPFKRALVEQDAGLAALEAGDLAAASAAFDRAAEEDPASPVLQAWRAHARERAGQEEEALAIYEQAIERFPRDVDLRYNRASLAARRGDVDLAGRDLRFLYARDLLDPMEVGEDPDFASLIEDPDTTQLVPQPQVWVEAKVEEGAVILGGSWALRLTVESPRGPEVEIRDMGKETGLLRHVRTVEDLLDEGSRTSRRTVLAEFTAVSPGKSAVGPWLVTAGATSAMTPSFDVEVVELPGRTSAEASAEARALQLPSLLLVGKEAPYAGTIAAGRVAMGRSGDELVLVGEGSPPGVELQLREKGQVLWVARLWPAATPGRVEVRRRGEVIASAD